MLYSCDGKEVTSSVRINGKDQCSPGKLWHLSGITESNLLFIVCVKFTFLLGGYSGTE